MTFDLDDAPILGMGEGGPLPGRDMDWKSLPVEFDRRGRLHRMNPRWQSDAYGSRNPVPLMIGTAGWAVWIATPWGEIDLRDKTLGRFMPITPADADSMRQGEADQNESRGKGLPPMDSFVPGAIDVFVFDARRPANLIRDLSVLTGAAAMPPRWALGYMQSHRTLEDDAQMVEIARTFRRKRIPVDALIYLGTGFTPRGWNTEQPSFEFNPAVFRRDPRDVIEDLHGLNLNVAVHMVPWDRDRLPALHGSIEPTTGELAGPGHIAPYWREHERLVADGIDAWWPDEGDWFDLWERMKRHEMYFTGPLSTTPDVRPWSLHRNGYLGVARWGGWIWSGDTQSTWKTLETQIAVGLNHSMSLSPFWGSDIGGFYPTDELTGELYARWFQFGAFCPSFRSHGKWWWTRLPWGWGGAEPGPDEHRTGPNLAALNDPTIEPVVKAFAELRYRLLPYNYSLAWEAHATGMPFMRALWLAYPDDPIARGLGNEYLWGPDLLVAPVFEPGATSREVYLPAGTWYDWWTGEPQAGGRSVRRNVDLSILPIYVRAGAIIPLDPIRQYTAEPVAEPTTLTIYPGADGRFVLYDDDGSSMGYQRGDADWILLTWDDAARTLTIEPGTPDGYATRPIDRTFRVQRVGETESKEALYDGGRTTVTF